MAARPSRSHWRNRRLPAGLLGMVILVALGETLVRQVEPGLVGGETWDWRRANARAGSDEVRSASILCFGDSLVKLGVQPRVLEARLGAGHRAYNLALRAGRAPASYFLLRRALRAGARPDAVVVDFNESFLAEPPETVSRLYSEILTIDEAWGIDRFDFFVSFLAFQALGSARDRFEIRRTLADLWNGRSTFARTWDASVAHRHNGERNLGAMVMPKLPSPPVVDLAWIPDETLGWQPNPTNARYLAAFLDLAQSHQIPVFWLLPPLHPAFAARRAETGLDRVFDAFVSRVVASHPGVVVVDARSAKFDGSLFIDFAHLDRDGSTLLSEALAPLIADRLAIAGHQFVALPPLTTSRVAAGQKAAANH